MIAGFVTVVSSELEPTKLAASIQKRLPRGAVPVLRLARMAVATDRQGKGTGKKLLAHVFKLAIEQAARAGCVGIVVDAKPDAVSFYKPYGFEEFQLVEGDLLGEKSPMPMFLAIGEIPRD